jgi:hypothetical protein
MGDTMIVGAGATLAPDAGTAVTEPPEQIAGPGSAAPETNRSEGGGSQESTEGGQPQTGGRRKFSMQDQVRELRAERRELREQLAQFGSMRDELVALREELNRRNQPAGAKTPADFWKDPESRLQALKDEMEEAISRQNAGLMEAFHRTREEEFERQDKLQRSASAAEFIRSQQGYDPSDDEDLIEIIKENDLAALGPERAANIAWSLLQQSRGVGDRGLAKRQAASVQGQPPGVGFGRKIWNKTEFDQAVDMVEQKMRGNPNDPKMNELFNELMAAHKEGRVK